MRLPRCRFPLLPALLLVGAPASLLTAQPAPPAGAAAVGATVGRPDPRIDSVFAFVRPGAPGCAVGVYRDGALDWARGYGLASVEHGVPITPRTVFDLGSTSKQFTAALALLLVADGRLSLDDPVRRHVPELPGWGDSVTVRHLLHHTGGVRDYLNLFSLAGVRTEDLTTQADAVRMVARQRELDFVPGSAYSYSNSGYLLLAEIVARRSGRPFAAVARERLFVPLGMTHTQLLDAHATLIPHKAESYVPDRASATGFALETSDFEQVGDGAVQSTLADLARWVANFERATVGGDALVRELETTTRLADGRPLDYARGLHVDTLRGLKRVRHGGAWIGFRSDLVRFPERRLAVAALCNRGDANPRALLDRVSHLLLDDLGVPRPTPARAAATAAAATPRASRAVAHVGRYVGLYVSPTTGLGLRLVARGDTLAGVLGDTTAFVPAGDGTFMAEGRPIALAFPGAGPGASDTARTAALTVGGGPADHLVRIAPNATVDAGTRASLVGRWHSAELDVSWTVAPDSLGRLTVALPRQAPSLLEPITPDVLRSRGMLIRLERAGAGRVSAFTIVAGRVRGMRFERAP